MMYIKASKQMFLYHHLFKSVFGLEPSIGWTRPDFTEKMILALQVEMYIIPVNIETIVVIVC